LVDDKTGFFQPIGPGQNLKSGNELAMNFFRPKNGFRQKKRGTNSITLI